MCSRTSSQESTSCLWLVTEVSSGEWEMPWVDRERRKFLVANHAVQPRGFVTDGLPRSFKFLFDHRHHASLDQHHP
jgi:hypothetical protein